MLGEKWDFVLPISLNNMPQWYLSNERAHFLWPNNKTSACTFSQGDWWFWFLFGFPFLHGRWWGGWGRHTKKLGKLVSTTAGAGKQEQGVGRWHRSATKCCPSYKISHDLQEHNPNSTSKALISTIGAIPKTSKQFSPPTTQRPYHREPQHCTQLLPNPDKKRGRFLWV